MNGNKILNPNFDAPGDTGERTFLHWLKNGCYSLAASPGLSAAVMGGERCQSGDTGVLWQPFQVEPGDTHFRFKIDWSIRGSRNRIKVTVSNGISWAWVPFDKTGMPPTPPDGYATMDWVTTSIPPDLPLFDIIIEGWYFTPPGIGVRNITLETFKEKL